MWLPASRAMHFGNGSKLDEIYSEWIATAKVPGTLLKQTLKLIFYQSELILILS